MSANKDRKANHLINEKSPYLLKHAYNPVEWHPWGEEAIRKAARENKPILLSIGYSTCHWCNVMEKESFSDPGVADVMNRHLVCIKLDREERPDIDKIYITVVTALTGSAGWPLNVFLTPELKPFFGGTYFPPEPRSNSPGWVDLIEEIGKAWNDPERRRQIDSSSDEIVTSIRGFLSGSKEAGEFQEKWIHDGFESINASFDPRHGGFSGAPKFPVPVIHQFLLRYRLHARTTPGSGEKGKAALDMSLFSLRKMAEGGIFDHLGGGFHRYSTDERWHLPHFEKMLYDNAQLAKTYLEAYQLSGDDFFANVAEKTLGYLLGELHHDGGGFYSAEDADSLPPFLADRFSHDDIGHLKEGAFYVWEKKEILQALGKDRGEIFCSRYGVEEEGNVRYDPMGEFPGKNVLYAARTDKELAGEQGMPQDKIAGIIRDGEEKLLEARSGRPRPLLDDKIITSWNGLAISALSAAHQALDEKKYLDAAARAAAFIRINLYDEETGQLYRRWRDGSREVPGMADDYTFLTQGLIDLYEASLDGEYLRWAIRLAREAISRFSDGKRGGYFMTEEGHDPYLIIRVKEDYDSVEPSPGSVAAMNLIRLSRYTEDGQLAEEARKTLRYFSSMAKKAPGSVPYLLSSAISHFSPPLHVVVVGSPDEELTGRLLAPVRPRFLPAKTVILLDDAKTGDVVKDLPFTEQMVRKEGKPTAYICVGYTCRQPSSDPDEVSSILDGIHGNSSPQ